MLRWLCLLFLSAMSVAEPACKAQINIGNQWKNVVNETTAGVLELTFSNPGTTNITTPWTLVVENPLYTDVLQSWNLQNLTTETGSISAQASLFWEYLLPNSTNAVNLGMVVEYKEGTAEEIIPSFISVAGIECDRQVIAVRKPNTQDTAVSNPTTGEPRTPSNTGNNGSPTNTSTPGVLPSANAMGAPSAALSNNAGPKSFANAPSP